MSKIRNQKFTNRVLRDGALLPSGNFTELYDEDKQPIYLGDKLLSKWGYEVIVIESDGEYVGKLVCDDNHSCKEISYALNKGNDYSKIT